ncbi:hypothetical protein [Tropicibacter alexandrii]|uniref:hypothetical protein n=1 Tax=Tropicibacter alexandrii TaxID=2267683 RepID=UPI000EF54EEB|nr:hypothetical protein [Tropicibacter alexandrii]
MVRKISRFAFFNLNALVFVYSLCEAWVGFAEMQPTQNILNALHRLDQTAGISDTTVFIFETASTLLVELLA